MYFVRSKGSHPPTPRPRTSKRSKHSGRAFPRTRKVGKAKARDLFLGIVTGKHAKRKADASTIVTAIIAGNGLHADLDFAPLPETWAKSGSMGGVASAGALRRTHSGQGHGVGMVAKERCAASGLSRRALAQRRRRREAERNLALVEFRAAARPSRCLLPAEVITENGFEEIYQGRINSWLANATPRLKSFSARTRLPTMSFFDFEARLNDDLLAFP